MKPIDLLKALFKVILSIIIDIIKNNWEPIYTTCIKMLIISLLLWSICSFVPHGLTFLTGISYLGWLVLIIVFRLITIKYDDFDEIEAPKETDEIPEIQTEEEPPEEVQQPEQPIGNVIRKESDDNGSTRE